MGCLQANDYDSFHSYEKMNMGARNENTFLCSIPTFVEVKEGSNVLWYFREIPEAMT
jgi:hypothetical protein